MMVNNGPIRAPLVKLPSPRTPLLRLSRTRDRKLLTEAIIGSAGDERADERKAGKRSAVIYQSHRPSQKTKGRVVARITQPLCAYERPLIGFLGVGLLVFCGLVFCWLVFCGLVFGLFRFELLQHF